MTKPRPTTEREPNSGPDMARPSRNVKRPIHTRRLRGEITSGLATYYALHFSAPCNLSCFFCYEQPRTSEEKSLHHVRHDLERARAAGYDRVAFSCGELLLLRSWKEMVRFAVELGFRERVLLTNLTLIDEESIAALVDAGITSVGATLVACSDEEGMSITGRPGVHSRQAAALRILNELSELFCGVHLILTREALADPWRRIAALLEMSPRRFSHVNISAIEPVRNEIIEHPSFVFGHDISWPELIEQAEKEGERLVVQNVPACRLGDWAHRSFMVRRRVARLLEGMPADRQLAREVSMNEVLFSRLPAAGSCKSCSLISVCHRDFDRAPQGVATVADPEALVARLLTEEGISAKPDEILAGLRLFAARNSADEDLREP